jgi:acyl carrier protein
MRMNEDTVHAIRQMLMTECLVDLPAERIGLDDGLRSMVGLDSLGFAELRNLCEERFGVRISDADFHAYFTSVRRVVELIDRLRAA